MTKNSNPKPHSAKHSIKPQVETNLQSQQHNTEPYPLDGLMNTKAAAAYLAISPLTLLDWRVKGVGPNVIRCGRCCRYRRSDLEAYIRANTQVGT
jgi:hypothetical protein